MLDVGQLIELLLALDRIGVVIVEFVDGVPALGAHVFGQLVGAAYLDLQALCDLVGQFVEHADRPVDRGQAQPAHFGQLHVAVVTTAAAAAGHIDIDRHRPGRGQQQNVVVVCARGRDVVVVSCGRRQSRIARFTDFFGSSALVRWSATRPSWRCLQDTRRRRLTTDLISASHHRRA